MLVKIITAGGDTTLPACHLSKIRVGGVAALVGAVQIKQGVTVIETLAAATAVGTERDFAAGGAGTKFDTNLGLLTINLASAGDTVIVLFN
jgi:hypothetical protein